MENEEDFYIRIGRNIASVRSHNNMTQDNLANKLSVSRISIVNIEKGRQKPTVYMLLKMALILNSSLETFVKGEVFDIDIKTNHKQSGEMNSQIVLNLLKKIEIKLKNDSSE